MDEQLEAEFMCQCKTCTVEIMGDAMPFRCMIFKSYEVFVGT